MSVCLFVGCLVCNKTSFLLLPLQPCSVQTPQGHDYEGCSYNGKGVSDVLALQGLASFQSNMTSGFLSSCSLCCLVSSDHRCVDPACRRDHGARPEGRVQGRPHRQDPHPDQPRLRRARGRKIWVIYHQIHVRALLSRLHALLGVSQKSHQTKDENVLIVF